MVTAGGLCNEQAQPVCLRPQVAVDPTFTAPCPPEPQAATGVVHPPFPSPPLGKVKMKASLVLGSSSVKGHVHFPLLKRERLCPPLPMSVSEAADFPSWHDIGASHALRLGPPVCSVTAAGPGLDSDLGGTRPWPYPRHPPEPLLAVTHLPAQSVRNVRVLRGAHLGKAETVLLAQSAPGKRAFLINGCAKLAG